MTVKRTNPGWEQKLKDELDREVPQILEASMLKVESEAKRIVYLGHPNHLNYQTGTLGRSITTEVSSPEKDTYVGQTGTNLVYAPIHEFGGDIKQTTKKGNNIIIHIPPRPYLTPAFEAKKGEVKSDIVRGISQIIRRVRR